MRRGQKFHAGRSLAIAGLALLAGAMGPGCVRGETLERQLLKSAPLILQKLRDLGYRSVGVLKFRVQVVPDTIRDDVGTLNSLMADRLETALAIATPDDADQQVRLARRASQVAAAMEPGASHLEADGRKALLEDRYEPAWGSGPIPVDALLTGVVEVEPNLKSMHVGILVFGGNQPELTMLQDFVAETDGLILNELGRGFLKRGPASDGGQPGGGPIAGLQILYDNVAVEPIETPDPGGRQRIPVIPEPREGQSVRIILKRFAAGPQRWGAVLKVNGENTLYRERCPDVDCSKWVLEPGGGPIEIPGFQKPDNRQAEEFRILSREESRGAEMDYGSEVGLISLTIFPEQPRAVPQPTDDAADLLAIRKACFPEEPATDAAELKIRIRRAATAAQEVADPAPPRAPEIKRGVIGAGRTVEREVKPVEFVSGPEPCQSLVIRYYRPQSGARPPGSE